MKGTVLKLWLTSAKDAPPPQPGAVASSRALPHRIQAIGEVSGHSADMDVEQTDQLIAYFEDIAPPPAVVGPAPPMSPGVPAPPAARDRATPWRRSPLRLNPPNRQSRR